MLNIQVYETAQDILRTNKVLLSINLIKECTSKNEVTSKTPSTLSTTTIETTTLETLPVVEDEAVTTRKKENVHTTTPISITTTSKTAKTTTNTTKTSSASIGTKIFW